MDNIFLIIVIIGLVMFILGLMVGVSLARPRYHDYRGDRF